jgi:hypothetical protein
MDRNDTRSWLVIHPARWDEAPKRKTALRPCHHAITPYDHMFPKRSRSTTCTNSNMPVIDQWGNNRLANKLLGMTYG